MRNEWLNELTPEERPSPYRDMAESIGVAATLKVAEEFGGMSWYFPKLDRALKPLRNARIRAEFDGSNHRHLARKYKLSESQIRSIVDSKDARRIPLSM